MTKRGHNPNATGQRCPECNHALNSHNDLAYCEVVSKTYGDCMCYPGGWLREQIEAWRAERRALFAAKRHVAASPGEGS